MAVAGAAPAKSTAPGAKPFQGQSITYLYSTNGPDLNATKVLIQKFDASTGATVNLDVVPYANQETIAEADLSAGRAPGVLETTTATTFGKDEVNLGQALGSAWVKSISPNMFGGDIYNGEIVGLPNQLTVDGFFVNINMFKKAGVPVPTLKSHYTWPQFVAMAIKVQKANSTPYAIAMDHSAARVADLFTTFGYNLFGNNGNSAGNASDLLTAMKYFGGLFQRSVFPGDWFISSGTAYAAGDTLFLAKEAPVLLSGSWELASFLVPSTGPSFKWSLVPSPCEVACGSMSGGNYMVAFTKSNDPTLAEAFIKFMSEPVNQAYMSVQSDTIASAVADAVPGVVKYTPAAAPSMQVFGQQAALFPAAGNISENANGFNAAGLVMEEQLTDVMAGTTTPQAATKATLAAAKANL
jgi:alpha-1,4-digalacturonate transport system substrate-binding protein